MHAKTLCLGVGAALAAGALGLWWSATGLRSPVFSSACTRGPRRDRALALTFDDGPSPGTLELAALLAAEGVRATFFVCGANIDRHPGILARLVAAGHEIGNHTYTHRRLCPRLGWRLNLLSPAEVYREFASTQARIVAETGVAPRVMRPPYGMRWFGLRTVARRLRMQDVLWTVIARDWELSTDEVVRKLLDGAVGGAILCLHDGRDIRPNPDITVTLEAVRRVIPRLKEQGYTFQTVSRLLQRES